jgi:BlaI family penicillinase repressor
MMPKPPQISDAEWDVMSVLWENAPLTGSEVADRLQAHPKTIKTLLSRLVKKGAVRYREEGNTYLYAPAVQKDKLIAAESRSFVERVFGGKATPALLHFVEQVEMSEDEIRELRELLERKSGGGNR